MHYFIPTKDFFSKETRSQYVAGQRYTVRAGNEKLAALAKQWLDEGKVFIPEVKSGQAQPAAIKGVGIVTDVAPAKPGFLERIFSWR
jgi:hypothetical protein